MGNIINYNFSVILWRTNSYLYQISEEIIKILFNINNKYEVFIQMCSIITDVKITEHFKLYFL